MSVESSFVHADSSDLYSANVYTAEDRTTAYVDLATLLFRVPAFIDKTEKVVDGRVLTETVEHPISGIPLFERKSLLDDDGGDQTTSVTLFPLGHSGAFGNCDVVISETGVVKVKRENDEKNTIVTSLPDAQYAHLSRLLIRLTGLESE
jgi:hypothetical protein